MGKISVGEVVEVLVEEVVVGAVMPVDHCEAALPLLRIMSLMRVSMGVWPTNLAKKSCWMMAGETRRSEDSLTRSRPKRDGWPG